MTSAVKAVNAYHFFNLSVFSKMRRRAMLRTRKPPVSPDEVIEPIGVYAH